METGIGMTEDFLNEEFPDVLQDDVPGQVKESTKITKSIAAGSVASGVVSTAIAGSVASAPVTGGISIAVGAVVGVAVYGAFRFNEAERKAKYEWFIANDKVVRSFLLQLAQLIQIKARTNLYNNKNPLMARLLVSLSHISFLLHAAMKHIGYETREHIEELRNADLKNRMTPRQSLIKKTTEFLRKRSSRLSEKSKSKKNKTMKALKNTSKILSQMGQFSKINTDSPDSILINIIETELKVRFVDPVSVGTDVGLLAASTHKFFQLTECFEMFAKQCAIRAGKFYKKGTDFLRVKKLPVNLVQDGQRESMRRGDIVSYKIALLIPFHIAQCVRLLNEYRDIMYNRGIDVERLKNGMLQVYRKQEKSNQVEFLKCILDEVDSCTNNDCNPFVTTTSAFYFNATGIDQEPSRFPLMPVLLRFLATDNIPTDQCVDAAEAFRRIEIACVQSE